MGVGGDGACGGTALPAGGGRWLEQGGASGQAVKGAWDGSSPEGAVGVRGSLGSMGRQRSVRFTVPLQEAGQPAHVHASPRGSLGPSPWDCLAGGGSVGARAVSAAADGEPARSVCVSDDGGCEGDGEGEGAGGKGEGCPWRAGLLFAQLLQQAYSDASTVCDVVLPACQACTGVLGDGGGGGGGSNDVAPAAQQDPLQGSSALGSSEGAERA